MRTDKVQSGYHGPQESIKCQNALISFMRQDRERI